MFTNRNDLVRTLSASLFSKLKPTCELLTTALRSAQYDHVNSTIEQIIMDIREFLGNNTHCASDSRQAVTNCFDYIAFPILLLLEKDYILLNNANDKRAGVPLKSIETAFRALQYLFTVIEFVDVHKYMALHRNALISHVMIRRHGFASAEEVTMSIVSSFSELVSLGDKLPQLSLSFDAETQISEIVAPIVSTLLDVATQEKSKLVRVSALQALYKYVTSSLIDGSDAIENTPLQAILPGVISSLFKMTYIVRGSGHETLLTMGSEVCAWSMKNLSIFICSTCKDSITNKTIEESDRAFNFETESESALLLDSFISTIQKEKITDTKQEGSFYHKLDPYLQKIFGYENYGQYFDDTVINRAHSIQFASALVDILLNCKRNLHKSVPALLESLMLVSISFKSYSNEDDDVESIKTSVDALLSDFNITPELEQVLTDRFMTLVTSVPEIIVGGTNDRDKKATFGLVMSYLKLAAKSRDNLRSVFALPNLMSKLSLMLVTSLELSESNREMEHAVSGLNTIQTVTNTSCDYPRKNYKYVTDASFIFELCESIGRDLPVDFVRSVIDYFHSMLGSAARQESYAINRRQSIMIIEHVLIGSQLREDDFDYREVINSLIPDILSIIEEQPRIKANRINLEERIWTRCLTLEILGTFAELVGNRDNSFQMFLISILSPILDMLGDNKTVVNESAFKTLHRMAIVGGHTGSDQKRLVTDFVASNADYIIDDLRYRIKFINLYPRSPFVLRTLFYYTTSSYSQQGGSSNDTLLGLMEDTLDSVFTGLDTGSNTSMEAFFGILSSVVSMVQTKPSNRGKTLVLKILEKTRHYLTVQDLSVQLYILDMINSSMTLFENQMQENEDEEPIDRKFIQIFNNLWPGMLYRLRLDVATRKNEDQVRQQHIRIKVLSLVARAHERFSDFLYGKIVNELWPILIDQYLKQSFVSRAIQQCKSGKVDNQFDYLRTTPDFKLMTAVVVFLSEITTVQSTPLMRKMGGVARGKCVDPYDFCKALLVLLDDQLPSEWISATQNVILNCGKTDPDAVWLLLWKESQTSMPWSTHCTHILDLI